MSDKSHWEQIYASRASDDLSWFQLHAERSLALIRNTAVALDGAIIDVGGGASALAADLLHAGYSSLWVLDISAAALDAARQRLGEQAVRIHWLESDVTRAELPPAHFDIWHDRAVFHFLTAADDRAAYVERACAAVRPGGHLIIATFAEDGPRQCSGLPVMRYDAAALSAEFAAATELVHTETETHRTPSGELQHFRYCHLRRH
jgi:SAM-dependent methyltransferase